MNISIIGLGVMGGSLGLALKQAHPEYHVTGFDSRAVLSAAREKKVIDTPAFTLPSAVKDADVVFVCTPVQTIISMLPRIARSVKNSALVTDMGSTKGRICREAKQLFLRRGSFIGGHPMTGSEKSGIRNADPLLFQNAVYVLCPYGPLKSPEKKLVSVLQDIGARVLILSPRDHDRIASLVSHVPQLLAVSLVNLVGKRKREHPAYLSLAAGGFRDMTRIASSAFSMWKDILSTNEGEIHNALRDLRLVLNGLEKSLNRRSKRTIRHEFVKAKSLRDSMPKNSKGFLVPLHDIFVWVDDKPGVIASIAVTLARAKINIKDIELLKIREGSGGTFRLSFDSEQTARHAAKRLTTKKFRVMP